MAQPPPLPCPYCNAPVQRGWLLIPLVLALTGCTVQLTDAPTPTPIVITATPDPLNATAAQTAAAAVRAVTDARATLAAEFGGGATATPVATPTAGPPPPLVDIGTPAPLDTWTVMVTGVTQQATIGREGTFEHMQRAQGVFVDVFATIHNGANTPQNMEDAQWTLVDRQGARYVMLGTQTGGSMSDPYIAHVVEVNREYLSVKVIPRGDIDVVATFDVAKDAPQVGLILDLAGQSQVTLGDIPPAPTATPYP